MGTVITSGPCSLGHVPLVSCREGVWGHAQAPRHFRDMPGPSVCTGVCPGPSACAGGARAPQGLGDHQCLPPAEPSFVYADVIRESPESAEGGDDRVYFFFTEVSVEYEFVLKLMIPRVARVCKVRPLPRVPLALPVETAPRQVPHSPKRSIYLPHCPSVPQRSVWTVLPPRASGGAGTPGSLASLSDW